MRNVLKVSRLFILPCLLLWTVAAESMAAVSILPDKHGQWGAVDAQGQVILPFSYEDIVELEDGYLMAAKLSEDSPGLLYGVFNLQGKLVVPVEFPYIEYIRRHKLFRVARRTAPQGFKIGYLNGQGEVAVPVAFDGLDFISNNKVEPVNIAKIGRRYGYVNILTGKVLIPIEYEYIDVGPGMVNAKGEGIVAVQKGLRFGVLTTDGKVLVPIEYDLMGDVRLDRGALAEKDGKLVYLNFSNGKFLGVTDAAVEFSSDYYPHSTATVEPALFDGFYAAGAYPSMNSAWRAWQGGELRWPAVPSIEIKGDYAYVAFSIFKKAKLESLHHVLRVKRTPQGFDLLGLNESANSVQSNNFLSFRVKHGVAVCEKCFTQNVPGVWRLLPADRSLAFAGIGANIKKSNNPGSELVLLNVIAGGGADRAGLEAGDVVTHINDHSVADEDIHAVTSLLRGKAGTSVRLTVLRDGVPLPSVVSVERMLVSFP